MSKRNEKEKGAWAGVSHAGSASEIYCFAQRWFFLHTRSQCSGAAIHGFKEIRYTSLPALDFIASAFPRARFIVSFREDTEKQANSGAWGPKNKVTAEERIQGATQTLTRWADEHPEKVFKMPLEGLSTASMCHFRFPIAAISFFLVIE